MNMLDAYDAVNASTLRQQEKQAPRCQFLFGPDRCRCLFKKRTRKFDISVIYEHSLSAAIMLVDSRERKREKAVNERVLRTHRDA